MEITKKNKEGIEKLIGKRVFIKVQNSSDFALGLLSKENDKYQVKVDASNSFKLLTKGYELTSGDNISLAKVQYGSDGKFEKVQ